MNITISVDEKLVKKVREVARLQGTSLNALIRRYLESIVGEKARAAATRELIQLLRERPGNSGGRKIRREEAYEGRE